MKPAVLITTSRRMSARGNPENFLPEAYSDCILQAGGMPVAALGNDAQDYLGHCSGLLLSGGVDVDPAYFGEPVLNDSVKIDAVRDAYELSLIQAFYRMQRPIFGICRGIQVLNVAFGGTLWQDLDSQLGLHHGDHMHMIQAQEPSMIFQCCGKEFETNSFHHQSIKKEGKNLRVTARAEDGVAEAVEHTAAPVFGVQWHPERMGDAGMMLFERFLTMCEER